MPSGAKSSCVCSGRCGPIALRSSVLHYERGCSVPTVNASCSCGCVHRWEECQSHAEVRRSEESKGTASFVAAQKARCVAPIGERTRSCAPWRGHDILSLRIWATWPSGKARVCKTLMRGFDSHRRLYNRGLPSERSPLFVKPSTHCEADAHSLDARGAVETTCSAARARPADRAALCADDRATS